MKRRNVRANGSHTHTSPLTDTGAPMLAAAASFGLAAVAPAGHVSFGLGIAFGAACGLIAVLTILGVLDG